MITQIESKFKTNPACSAILKMKQSVAGVSGFCPQSGQDSLMRCFGNPLATMRPRACNQGQEQAMQPRQGM